MVSEILTKTKTERVEMGCLCCKTAPTGPSRKNGLLLQARYALPLSVLVQANDMPEEKVNEFKEAFKKVAKSSTGTISPKEVGPLMKATKHIENDKEIRDLMEQAGVKDTDEVDFDWFMKMVLGYNRRLDPEVEMRDAFAVADDDKDGVINSHDLRRLFSSMGSRLTDVEVALLIKEADLNGDGLVDYNEFLHLLCDPGNEGF